MSWILLGNSVIKWGSSIKSVPVPVSAEVTNDDPNKVVITFDQALNETSIPATTDFALAGKTISDVDVSGATVILTVSEEFIEGEVIADIAYTKPLSDMLISLLGSYEVASFSGLSVTNNIIYEYYSLSSYGTGLGVSFLVITVSSDILLVLTGTARFYSDAGGTLNESTSWLIESGASRTVYYRCPSGTALLKVSNFSRIISWRTSNPPNSSVLSGNIELLSSATYISIEGMNTTSGSLLALNSSITHLTISYQSGLGTLCGAVTGDIPSSMYPNLTSFDCISAGNVSFDITGRTGLIKCVSSSKYVVLKGSLSGVGACADFGGVNVESYAKHQVTWGNFVPSGTKFNFGIYNSLEYAWSINDISECIVAHSSATWSGHTYNSFYILYNQPSMADTAQGGIWGDFSGEVSPSALAIAFKTLWKVKLASSSNKAVSGITAPGATGDGTGFPAGFGDWYRS